MGRTNKLTTAPPIAMSPRVLNIALMMLLVRFGRGELFKEGDNLSLECGDDDWKYCKWANSFFSCDRGISPEIAWCNKSQGLRWSQGSVCGLDVVGLRPEHAGNWTAATIGKVGLEVTKSCAKSIEMAQKSTVSIINLGSELVANKAVVVECSSEGGNPPAYLDARLEVSNKSRNLEALEEESLGDISRLFSFVPQVEDKKAGDTFVVCQAIQKVGDDEIFRELKTQQINIVYPPQRLEKKTTRSEARVNHTCLVELEIEVFPLPNLGNIIWIVKDMNISQSIQVNTSHSFFISNSTEFEYIICNKLTSRNIKMFNKSPLMFFSLLSFTG